MKYLFADHAYSTNSPYSQKIKKRIFINVSIKEIINLKVKNFLPKNKKLNFKIKNENYLVENVFLE